MVFSLKYKSYYLLTQYIYTYDIPCYMFRLSTAIIRE